MGQQQISMQQSFINQLNQSSTVYYPVVAPQLQQPKNEFKKRDKKLLKIFNDDGTEFNLINELDKDVKYDNDNEVTC